MRRLPVAINYNFGQILTFRGSCTDPFLPTRAKFGALWHTCGVRLRAKFRLNRFILSPSGGKNPQFCHFWTSAFSGVAKWQQSEKVEHGCRTTNLALSNGIKIVSVLQRLYGKIGRTVSDVRKHDEQTDRQTKILNVLGHPSGG